MIHEIARYASIYGRYEGLFYSVSVNQIYQSAQDYMAIVEDPSRTELKVMWLQSILFKNTESCLFIIIITLDNDPIVKPQLKVTSKKVC